MRLDTPDMPHAVFPQRRSRLEPLVWICWGVALIHLLANRICWRGIPMQADVGIWNYVAWRMGHGARLYADLWDQKPPGIYCLFYSVQRLFGEQTPAALLWLDALVSVLVFVITYRACRLIAGRAAAALGVAMLGFVFGHRVLADWGCNCEKFVAMFEVIATGLILRALATNDRRLIFVAGVACGFAALFKQTGIALLLSVGVVLVFAKSVPHRRDFASRMLLGFASVWVPVIAILAWYGILGDFVRDVLLYDLSRVTSHSSSTPSGVSALAEHVLSTVQGLEAGLILMGPALVAILYLSLRPRDAMPTGRTPAAGLLIVTLHCLICIAIFIVAPQAYGHFLLQAAPSAAILAGWGADEVFASRHRRSWGLAYALVAALGLASLGDHFRFTFDPHYSYRDAYNVMRAKKEKLIAAAKSRSSADEAVMLWPPDDTVSFMARRRTPLELSNLIIDLRRRMQLLRPAPEAIVDHLAQDPPAIIIDTTRFRITPAASKQSLHGDLEVAAGMSLWEEPDADHPVEEGRILFPLKQWVREHYGGQEYVPDVGTILYRDRPWRSWWEVLPAHPGPPS